MILSSKHCTCIADSAYNVTKLSSYMSMLLMYVCEVRSPSLLTFTCLFSSSEPQSIIGASRRPWPVHTAAEEALLTHPGQVRPTAHSRDSDRREMQMVGSSGTSPDHASAKATRRWRADLGRSREQATRRRRTADGGVPQYVEDDRRREPPIDRAASRSGSQQLAGGSPSFEVAAAAIMGGYGS
jgi:hypothetical protein